MAIPTVTTAANAAGAGWVLCGQDGNWWAEKVVQEGKVLAVGATSAALLTSIANSEFFHEKLALSPMRDKNAAAWHGHI